MRMIWFQQRNIEQTFKSVAFVRGTLLKHRRLVAIAVLISHQCQHVMLAQIHNTRHDSRLAAGTRSWATDIDAVAPFTEIPFGPMISLIDWEVWRLIISSVLTCLGSIQVWFGEYVAMEVFDWMVPMGWYACYLNVPFTCRQIAELTNILHLNIDLVLF